MFTSGRIAFIIFFVIVFVGLMVFSYKKDAKNHQHYYKNTAKKVTIYGLLVVILFVAFRYLTSIL